MGHEVIKPFIWRGAALDRGEAVDTAGWAAHDLRQLVEQRFLRPLDEPEADSGPDAPADSDAPPGPPAAPRLTRTRTRQTRRRGA